MFIVQVSNREKIEATHGGNEGPELHQFQYPNKRGVYVNYYYLYSSSCRDIISTLFVNFLYLIKPTQTLTLTRTVILTLFQFKVPLTPKPIFGSSNIVFIYKDFGEKSFQFGQIVRFLWRVEFVF